MSTDLTPRTPTTLAAPGEVVAQVTQTDIVRLLAVEHEDSVKAEIARVTAQITELDESLSLRASVLAQDVQQQVEASVKKRAETVRAMLRSLLAVGVEYAPDPRGAFDPSLSAVLDAKTHFRAGRFTYGLWPQQKVGHYHRYSPDGTGLADRVEWAWWEILDDWYGRAERGESLPPHRDESTTTQLHLLVDGAQVNLPMWVDFTMPDLDNMPALFCERRELFRRLSDLERSIADTGQLERRMHAALTRRTLERSGVSLADLLPK